MNRPQTDSSPAGMIPRNSAGKRDRVVAALRGVEQGERESLDSLRTALFDYIATLRAEGIGAEDVRRIVADLIATQGDADGERKLPGMAREALVELASHWCAEELAKGS